jgi:hypothetical protein
MEQTMEFLKATEEMMERQIGSLKADLRTMPEKMDSHNERMMAKMNRHQQKMVACLGKTEAYPEMMKANPQEMGSTAMLPQVPLEEAAVKSFGALKKRRRGRHLGAG